MSQLPLDDVEWHTFARHLNSVGMAELMRREPAADASGHGELP